MANTDKNLGPCVIEIAQYIKDGLAHLNDATIYEPLTKAEASEQARDLCTSIFKWIADARNKKVISKDDAAYLRHHTAKHVQDPHGYFYLLYKVHKKELATRPVCSDCGSITYPLSKWVDLMLQPIAQSMPSFI